MMSTLITHKRRLILVLIALVLATLALSAPLSAPAQAQGLPDCPIRILMYDTLILRVSPTYGAAASTTLVKDNSVCLTGRTTDASWVQVASVPPNGAQLGWAPASAFWTTVSINVLPVTYNTQPPVATVTPAPPLFTPTPIPVTPLPATPIPPGTVTYVVQAGDTAFRIALNYGITLNALVAANNIPADYKIYVGQVLVIPGVTPATPAPVVTPTPPATTYTTYVVQAGDYLVKIANQYGINWSQIAVANNINAPYIIYVGQSLLIPAAG